MCKKLIPLVCIVLVLGLADSVSAGYVHHWIGDPGEPSFCNPQAWDSGVKPGPDDTVYIDPPPHQGPVVDCNVGIDKMYGPIFHSDADQVMNFESGDFEVDVWKLAQTGTGKATINIGGDSNVTAAAGNDYEFGGIHGPQSGDVEINITDDATFTVKYAERGIHLGTHTGTTTVWNISGNAQVKSYGKHAIQLADNGTVIVNISENASISHSKWRNCDSDGYVEIHMTGGEITGGYLSIYDDGSGIFDFSGGTVDVEGLIFKGGKPSSWCEINVSGTAEVYAWVDVRLSSGGSGASTLNISGGSLYSDFLGMGSETAVSTLNMTGGLLEVGVEIAAPKTESATANINLDGGTIECKKFSHGGDNWQMDVCGGTMIIDGNVVSEIEADIASGHITACDGAQGYSVVVDYDNINPGKTTLRVKPCPCPGDLADPLGQVDLQDLDATVNMLVTAGPPFIIPVEAGNCADMIEPTDQVDLQDLDALVNLLVNAGPPFIVPCE